MDNARQALFISHATPSGNAFARWLGAKLAAMGYEVWADVMRLRGGDDWARDLEDALRNKSIKLLVACSPKAMDAQGVRNEIEMGANLSTQLKDPKFIIPLRLESFNPHFRIAQSQYIDFSKSWANGLAELIDLLLNIHKIPRAREVKMHPWISAQAQGARKLVARDEVLASNWLTFKSVPAALVYSEPPSGFPLEKFQERTLHKWPVVPSGGGVLSFAEPDADGQLAPDMPAKRRAMVRVDDFLAHGSRDLAITAQEARRHFSDLGNQAWEQFLNGRGLISYEMANRLRAWWGQLGTVPPNKIKFTWPQQKGLRQIIGQSGKRGVHWHYAITGQVRTWPLQHLRVYSRLIFSENGRDPIPSVKKMHRLRRSFAKSWRNARWRDMFGAFLWWLSEGKTEIRMPVSPNFFLVLSLPPLAFTAPVTVMDEGAAPEDEDDPDVDEEIEDDEGATEGESQPDAPASEGAQT
jgi:hypothetical protein